MITTIIDPPGARDANGNIFVMFLWVGEGANAEFDRAIAAAGADHVRFRDRAVAHPKPNVTRYRFTAYRDGVCITDEVLK